jgi:ElaA protein
VTLGSPAPIMLRSAWSDLTPALLHDLVALRIDVFVVEQKCPYPELDGRDVEPDAEQVWTQDDRGPTACLRVLTDPDGAARIGRVCTRADARGRGLAAALITDVLDRTADRVVVLEAQSHLAGWYGRFGFRADGPEYVEDGIPHLPMRRAPGARQAGARQADARQADARQADARETGARETGANR